MAGIVKFTVELMLFSTVVGMMIPLGVSPFFFEFHVFFLVLFLNSPVFFQNLIIFKIFFFLCLSPRCKFRVMMSIILIFLLRIRKYVISLIDLFEFVFLMGSDVGVVLFG